LRAAGGLATDGAAGCSRRATTCITQRRALGSSCQAGNLRAEWRQRALGREGRAAHSLSDKVAEEMVDVHEARRVPERAAVLRPPLHDHGL
jgi:hypothetical protein